MKKKILIPIFLSALALPLSLAGKFTGNEAYFIGINDKNDYLAHGLEVNAQLADEGMVLLKNLDDFLPMNGDEKISVVGKSSTNLVKGGGGSGDASVSNGVHYIDLQESLTNAGFEINPDLTTFYKSSSASGSGRTNGNSGWKGLSEVTIGETPFSSYTDALKSSMENDYNDAAIMVISREGSEGCDVKPCNAHDSIKTNNSFEAVSHKHALQLSDNEQDLFDYITEVFDNVIIIINSGNVFQCDAFENNDAVKAVIWSGTVGDVGAGAIGRILNGDVNPSGHTVDTWARDFTKDPTYQNFSDNAQTNLVTNANGKEMYVPADTMFNADGSPVKSEGSYKGEPKWQDQENKVVEAGLNGVRPSSYVSYEEGIYVDYRYYETRYAEIKEAGGDADSWYEGDEGVIYPFGYGLSYTEFEQKIVSSNIDHKMLKSGNMEVEVEVEVKNVGTVAGKGVVQLYWKAPYTAGGIEKAYNSLCAFDKTDMLEPGEKQVLTLRFNTQEVANYDFDDKNNNGFCGYELDGGDYQISLNKNAHEEIDVINFKVAEGGIQYEVDLYTGNPVENRFTDRGFYSSLPSEDDFEFTQFSREDMEETFPSHPTIEDRTLGASSRVQEFFTHAFTPEDIDTDKTNYEYMPKEAYKSKEDIEELGYVQQDSKLSSKTIKFTELYNLDYDDPKWDEFLNQLTYDELLDFTTGGSQNTSITGADKPSLTSQDGPQKFKGASGVYWVCLPIAAATYNADLVAEQGRCIGNETIYTSNTYGWCGPAVNIHRSPFGGRNFEYYSADPLISGRMGGRVVAGATDGGIYCFFKHFAVNDQEKHREGVAAFLNEQALREIYLKAFQYVVQEGKATGIMSSYNRIGLMESAASYPLLTEVLRNEWGFKGQCFSDMTHHSNSAFDRKYYENINNRILAGDSQQLDSSSYKNDVLCSWSTTLHCPTYNGTPSYSWWYAVRKAAHDTMYSAARCAAVAPTKIPEAGLTFDGAFHNVYKTSVGEEVNIKINIPEQYADYEIRIDEFTPLPDGIELNGDVISGSSDVPVNKFIHVILVNNNDRVGTSFELVITAVGNDAEYEEYEDEKQPGKKGCFGGVEASLISIATVSVLALGVLLINKKRKIAE